jgi:hypothetical protein
MVVLQTIESRLYRPVAGKSVIWKSSSSSLGVAVQH